MVLLPKPAFFELIMPVPEAPWWYLTLTPIKFWKRGRVLLQDPETYPPMLAVKMVPHAVPGL